IAQRRVGGVLFEYGRPALDRLVNAEIEKQLFLFEVVAHGDSLHASRRSFSQARAKLQSRFTVAAEISIASAASSMLRPPKKRSSTRRAIRGLFSSSSLSASSSASRSTSAPGDSTLRLVSVMR